MKLKEKYQELSKKHNLPSFEELDKEFEISTIENEEFLLREVRRKIIEKIEAYTKFLEEILQPETTLANMYEAKVFDEDERNEIFKLYQRLMSLDRLSMELALDENDDKTSKFIKDFFEEWNEIKENLSKFVKKAKEEWLKETDIKEKLRYLG
ncbi:MAG: hypothetical protein V3V78_02545 [Candidatus Woesearchaeota archaeon]